ncbi:MAG: hypothetical protein P1U80_08785 [Pseudomonadales bacterium]|nr:hypothetical protein [Pseudomonadales bacterium]
MELAETVFLSEIVRQAEIAKLSATRLKSKDDETNSLEIWCSLQSILIASGNVSKILWPSRQRSKERGENLRSLLGIENGNMLEERKLRNHFEHYDERIGDWCKTNQSAVYIDSKIEPFETGVSGIEQFAHREYNPLTKVFMFRGEKFDIGGLLVELEKLTEKCGQYVLS